MALVLDTKVNTRKAKREIRELSDDGAKSIKKLERQSTSSSRAMAAGFVATTRSLAGLGALFAGGSGLSNVIRLASDMEEVNSRFRVVFKDIEDEATATFAKIADEVGRSNLAMQRFAGNTADILKPLGFATSEALTLSASLTRLALDVASFTNAQDADVIRAFNAALTGERESLKTYGIVISEADVKQEAYTSGLQKQGQELTKTQKALATYNLLLANTKDAQGDATRTAESFANQSKRLAANMEELGVNIGTIVLPGVNKLTTDINKLFSTIRDIGAQETALTGLQVGILNALGLYGKAADEVVELGEKIKQNTAEQETQNTSLGTSLDAIKGRVANEKTINDTLKERNKILKAQLPTITEIMDEQERLFSAGAKNAERFARDQSIQRYIERIMKAPQSSPVQFDVELADGFLGDAIEQTNELLNKTQEVQSGFREVGDIIRAGVVDALVDAVFLTGDLNSALRGISRSVLRSILDQTLSQITGGAVGGGGGGGPASVINNSSSIANNISIETSSVDEAFVRNELVPLLANDRNRSGR
jgi:hypothetical protein